MSAPHRRTPTTGAVTGLADAPDHGPTAPPAAGRTAPARVLVAALASVALLAGCSSSDDDDDGITSGGIGGEAGDDGAGFYAFTSGATPTRDAGQIERLTLGDTIVSSGKTPATGSDIVVDTDGTDVYEIGRFQLDTLTRFRAAEPTVPVYQYSVNDDDEIASNPYDIVFLNQERAYIVRYGSPRVWVVNPSAPTEEGFKLGELDLSGYDTDSVPQASNGVIVDDKLFVLMQRLDESFAPTRAAYVAVFDTATDQEIDTGMGTDGLLGIPLQVTNPEGLQYVESTDEILVTGRGNIFGGDAPGDPYQGGIVSIDPTAYTADLLVDDGTAEVNQDFIAESLVVSDEAGYLLTYRITDAVNFTSESALRRFDPRTGMVADGVVAGLEGRNLAVMGLGPDGNLWVGESGDAPGFVLVDLEDDTVEEAKVATEFNPTGLVFVPVPAAADASLENPR